LCPYSPTAGTITVIVNNPPCSLGSTDPHNGDNHYVEVVVSQRESAYFSRMFGVTAPTVSARAEATLPGGSSCLFALGTSGADITLAFSLSFESGCGWVDESSSSNAFSGFLGFYDVPYFGIVGGNSCFLCFPIGGGATAKTGIKTPNPADPLAYLQPDLSAEAPSPASCGTSTKSPYTGHSGGLLTINSTATLYPGTYCGGISIAPGANVTMNPGIYTLTSTSGSNGGLSIDAGTTVAANGVGFYNYGPNGGVDFLFSSVTAGAVTLTAPNSTNCSSCGSAWQGILFYQDPGDSATSVVVGSASWNTKLTGTSYFPDANITYALDLQVNYNEVVAQSVTLGFQININGTRVGTSFYNNYAELANGNPIKNTVPVLSE